MNIIKPLFLSHFLNQLTGNLKYGISSPHKVSNINSLWGIQHQPNNFILQCIPLMLILHPRIFFTSNLFESRFYIPPTHFIKVEVYIDSLKKLIHTGFTKDCSLLWCPLSSAFELFWDGIQSPLFLTHLLML